MEEKIIEAKLKKNNTFAYIIGGIGILLLLIGIAESYSAYKNRFEFSPYCDYDSFFDYLFDCFIFPFNDSTIGIWLVYIGILSMITFGVIALMMNRCAMSITNTRVIGKASFGKQVDLPMNQISAIGLGAFSSITVATSAGRVHFWLIENRNEVHSALNELLVKLQSESKSNTTTVSTPPTSTADELKKYKELLDAGVITQEEFDAKKKQLLGL